MMAWLKQNSIMIQNYIISNIILKLLIWPSTVYKDSFNNQDIKSTVSSIEQLLSKASQGQDYTSEFEHTCSFYKGDFQSHTLHAQLQIFKNEGQRQIEKDTGILFATIFDIRKFFCTLTDSQKSLLSEVCKVVKLILIMPATNATSERSFSALLLSEGLFTYIAQLVNRD